jgi:hypothetical protein
MDSKKVNPCSWCDFIEGEEECLACALPEARKELNAAREIIKWAAKWLKLDGERMRKHLRQYPNDPV